MRAVLVFGQCRISDLPDENELTPAKRCAEWAVEVSRIVRGEIRITEVAEDERDAKREDLRVRVLAVCEFLQFSRFIPAVEARCTSRTSSSV